MVGEEREPSKITLELFKDVNRKMETLLKGSISVELLKKDISYIKEKVDLIEQKINSEYVTKSQFDLEVTPLKRIVYGAVGFILLSFLTVLAALVFKSYK